MSSVLSDKRRGGILGQDGSEGSLIESIEVNSNQIPLRSPVIPIQ